MPPAALRGAALLLLTAVALLGATAADGRGGAEVKYRNLVLRANGGFEPQLLPKRGWAPIDFRGQVTIAARDGGVPLPLRSAVVRFDADGRLSAGGLPTCAAEQVAGLGTEEARALCAGAIVGEGRVEALVALPGSAPVPVASPLTIFNGPAEAGHPTVVLHARTAYPATQTYAIPVPITRLPGEYGYRADLQLPPIAGGFGSITRIRIEVGRRFEVDGVRRSYVSAHCSDGTLRTRGGFTFSDGTLIEGSVEKFCRAYNSRPTGR